MKSLRQVWHRSLPPPVAEAGRRSVGNRKERLRDYASSPDRQPNVLPNPKEKQNQTAFPSGAAFLIPGVRGMRSS